MLGYISWVRLFLSQTKLFTNIWKFTKKFILEVIVLPIIIFFRKDCEKDWIMEPRAELYKCLPLCWIWTFKSVNRRLKKVLAPLLDLIQSNCSEARANFYYLVIPKILKCPAKTRNLLNKFKDHVNLALHFIFVRFCSQFS